MAVRAHNVAALAPRDVQATAAIAASIDSLILPSTSSSNSTSTAATSPSSSSSGSMWPTGDVSTPETEEELGEIVALLRLGPAFLEAAEPPQELVLMDHFHHIISVQEKSIANILGH
ncbi:hypothetical protein SAY86_027460 [Trapa natans]|uniref:Uncharacterized protein n=1 Tax=Trapa natans TaxID=22666 RepID=A0AAN7QM85_TRANT|nr:hypothetical protein SAY86_027460 [Trapa natans]